jgi:cleavage and polyadenylation specificity factor subunit 1
MIVRTDNSSSTKLVLVAEIPLAGTVIGLARLKLKNTISGGEALILAYRAAKLCVTEWDPKRNSLETLSLHFYEKDDLQAAPWELPLGEYVNYLTVDPGSRCAAFKFGSRNLAILPFRKSEEDIAMDDWDEDLDGPRPVKAASTMTNGTNGDIGSKEEAAHTPSFVLRLPLLDPTLLHPVHMAFLHEYREPTFGILSSMQPQAASLGLKDHLIYKVFTLDLQQQASTTILSVTDLPRDLFRVMALPAPIGGALLIGENELIHVDQSGKSNGLAVNPMTKQITSFSLADESHLNLRLEGCTIEILSIEHGDLLLITRDGTLAVITFRIDGRTVSGIDIGLVSKDCGGEIIKTGASCVSKLGKNAFFVGSENSDSVVLGCTRRQVQEKRRKTRALDADLDIDDEDLDLDDDEDDDLYGNDSGTVKPIQAAAGSRAGDMSFRIHDTLLSIAPIHEMTCGQPSFDIDSEDAALSRGVTADLSLACAVGKGRAGSLAILNRQIQPKVVGRFEFPEARGFWTMCVKKPVPKSLAGNAASAGAGAAGDYDVSSRYDRYMIVAKVDLDGYETSDVYALTAAGFESIKDTEFEPAAGFTVEAGTMGKQMRIIQVLKSEVRCYDGSTFLAILLVIF